MNCTNTPLASTRAISYALDIGVYETGAKGQMLSATTAAWCRAPTGTLSLRALAHAGSPCEGRFYRSGGSEEFPCGRSLPRLAQSIAQDLQSGYAVAIGFEAPMWLPLEHQHRPQLRLFGPRFDAERGSEWYLQSGAAASLKAITLGVLFREQLHSELGGSLPRLSTNPDDAGGGVLVLFEAFVVGAYKVLGPGVPDEADALIAAVAWGAAHRGFMLPKDLKAVTLHRAGQRQGPCFSIWSTIFSGYAIQGPPDCDVVALSNGEACAK